jgi:hypothetical protein
MHHARFELMIPVFRLPKTAQIPESLPLLTVLVNWHVFYGIRPAKAVNLGTVLERGIMWLITLFH